MTLHISDIRVPLVRIFPTSRFLATRENCTFPTQVDRVIYTKVERGHFDRDLTWRTARGVTVWIGSRTFYVPLFFWRQLV